MAFRWTVVDQPPPREVRERRWARCSRARPCAVCGKGDWCTFADDGAACCMRDASDRPARNGGWIHDGASVAVGPVQHGEFLRARVTRSDCGEIIARWRAETPTGLVQDAAQMLGLPAAALDALGVAWAACARALAFPMVDHRGEVVGIRLREPRDAGADKWSVTGSRAGLFIPAGTIASRASRVFVCEGPTDTAALHGSGLAAIGRPSCHGQETMVRDAIAAMRPRPEVVVLADGDGPGINGARRLADLLVEHFPGTKLLQPPPGIKDARAWLRGGGTRREIELRAHARAFHRRTHE
jgi:5S rRNA maturation endonuclease (ribonuclease M5)